MICHAKRPAQLCAMLLLNGSLMGSISREIGHLVGVDTTGFQAHSVKKLLSFSK